MSSLEWNAELRDTPEKVYSRKDNQIEISMNGPLFNWVEIIIWIDHRKKFQRPMFRSWALRQSK